MVDVVNINKMKYGWTKYGGARHGLVKHRGEWTCQACAADHPDSLPAYMFNVDNGAFREFIRICAPCYKIAKVEKIKDLIKLIRRVRRRKHWYDYIED